MKQHDLALTVLSLKMFFIHTDSQNSPSSNTRPWLTFLCCASLRLCLFYNLLLVEKSSKVLLLNLSLPRSSKPFSLSLFPLCWAAVIELTPACEHLSCMWWTETGQSTLSNKQRGMIYFISFILKATYLPTTVQIYSAYLETSLSWILSQYSWKSEQKPGLGGRQSW